MSYLQQIAAAITSMKDRKGSSLHAIKAFLGADKSTYRFINSALRKGVESGALVKNAGRYKVAKNFNQFTHPSRPPARPPTPTIVPDTLEALATRLAISITGLESFQSSNSTAAEEPAPQPPQIDAAAQEPSHQPGVEELLSAPSAAAVFVSGFGWWEDCVVGISETESNLARDFLNDSNVCLVRR